MVTPLSGTALTPNIKDGEALGRGEQGKVHALRSSAGMLGWKWRLQPKRPNFHVLLVCMVKSKRF